MNTRSSIRELLKSADNWLLAFLGVMSVVFFVDTWHFRPAAAMFPRLIAGIVAALCIYQLGENIWTWWAGKSPAGKKAKEQQEVAIAWYWIALAIALYLVLILVIGFNPATLVFLLVFPRLVGYRRWSVTVPVAIVLTVAVAFSFGSMLHVQLPVGLLGSAMGW
jgi:hypothetical protein